MTAEKTEMQKTIMRIRDQKEWTQEKLAQEIGVSFSTVNAWERGRRKPQPVIERIILRLAKSLKD